MTFLLGSLVTM